MAVCEALGRCLGSKSSHKKPCDPGDQEFSVLEEYGYCLWYLSSKWCLKKKNREGGDCSFKFWFYKVHELGVREMARWIKCLPCKHEDQSSGPQHACKSQASVMLAYIPSTTGIEKGRGMLVSAQLARLMKAMRDVALVNKVDNDQGRHQMSTSDLYLNVQACAHTPCVPTDVTMHSYNMHIHVKYVKIKFMN